MSIINYSPGFWQPFKTSFRFVYYLLLLPNAFPSPVNPTSTLKWNKTVINFIKMQKNKVQGNVPHFLEGSDFQLPEEMENDFHHLREKKNSHFQLSCLLSGSRGRRGLVWASFYDTEFTLRDKVRALKGHDAKCRAARGARKGARRKGGARKRAHVCWGADVKWPHVVAARRPAQHVPLVFYVSSPRGSEYGFVGLGTLSRLHDNPTEL